MDNDNDLRSSQHPELNMPASGGKKRPKWLLPTIGVVALVLIVVGIYFALPKKQSGNSVGGYGSLPMADDSKAQPSTTPNVVATGFSGLSGQPCEHSNRRPIGVMLGSDPIARPLSGFSKADLVFELPVLTNDVTRLMLVYQCGEPEQIGGVRSVRHDYLFLADGIDAIVAHWGGSYHALNRIEAGEYQTINALQNPNNAFFRVNFLQAPYNGYTKYSNLWETLQKLGYRATTTFPGYSFKDDAATADRGTAGTLTIGWPGAFRVSYDYDPATNRYIRSWGSTKQLEGTDKTQIAPSTVVVMRATNGPMTGPGGYNDVGIEGKGPMEVYQDGKVIKGTWSKNEMNKKDPLKFVNEQGQPIIFTRGQVWITAVEPEVSVTWQAAAAPAN